MPKVDMGKIYMELRGKRTLSRVQGKSKAVGTYFTNSDFGSDIHCTCGYMIQGRARQDICKIKHAYRIFDFSSNLHHSRVGNGG